MPHKPRSTDSDLRMLRDSVVAFREGKIDHRRSRSLRGTLPGYDTAIAHQMAELGWYAVLIPEHMGGLGLGIHDMAVIASELGKGLLTEPLVARAVLASRTLVHCANPALQARCLPRLASGELDVVLAWQEKPDSMALDCGDTHATRTGEQWSLDGSKRFIAGAGQSTAFLVSAQAKGGTGLFWVDANAPGVSIQHHTRADGTPSTTLSLANAVSTDVVCPPGAALAVLERATAEAAVIASAEMEGIASHVLNMTLDYMRTRVQFGKAIGTFQALQHHAADLYILKEIASSVLMDAVDAMHAWDDPATEDAPLQALRLASRAKARCGDSGLKITRDCLQLHGAIGFTDEYDLGLYLKRVLVLSAWLGNAPMHRQRFERSFA